LSLKLSALELERYRPRYTHISSLSDVAILPRWSFIQAKPEGEFVLAVFSNGSAEALTVWGRLGLEVRAVAELKAYGAQEGVRRATLLGYLYAVDPSSGRPVAVEDLERAVKEDPSSEMVRVGVFDMAELLVAGMEAIASGEPWGYRIRKAETLLRGELVTALPYAAVDSMLEARRFWERRVLPEGWNGAIIRVGDELYQARRQPRLTAGPTTARHVGEGAGRSA